MNQAIKSLIKCVVRPFWRMLAPLRRFVARKLHHHLSLVAAEILREPSARLELAVASLDRLEHSVASLDRLEVAVASLDRLEQSVAMARKLGEQQNLEANLLFDSMVREVARLQMQIEELRETVELAIPAQEITLMDEADSNDLERKAG